MTQQRVYIQNNLGLGTLGSDLVLKSALRVDASRENGVRITKLKAAVSYNGKTATEGPLLVGLCSTDLSTTEIAEALAADPQKPDDVPASEQVMRQVFPIWLIPAGPASEPDTKELVEISYPWKEVAEGDGLAWFVQNRDGNALTTGCTIEIHGVCIGEWLND